jgi:hypothetical protein
MSDLFELHVPPIPVTDYHLTADSAEPGEVEFDDFESDEDDAQITDEDDDKDEETTHDDDVDDG